MSKLKTVVRGREWKWKSRLADYFSRAEDIIIVLAITCWMFNTSFDSTGFFFIYSMCIRESLARTRDIRNFLFDSHSHLLAFHLFIAIAIITHPDEKVGGVSSWISYSIKFAVIAKNERNVVRMNVKPRKQVEKLEWDDPMMNIIYKGK